MTQTANNEERDLLASFERGEWQSTPNLEREVELYRAYAAKTLERRQRISVRLLTDDLQLLQQQAEAAGISKEAFIERLVHERVAGIS